MKKKCLVESCEEWGVPAEGDDFFVCDEHLDRLAEKLGMDEGEDE